MAAFSKLKFAFYGVICLSVALLFLYVKQKIDWVTNTCLSKAESLKVESWFEKMWSWLSVTASTVFPIFKSHSSTADIGSPDSDRQSQVSCQSSLAEDVLRVLFSHLITDATDAFHVIVPISLREHVSLNFNMCVVWLSAIMAFIFVFCAVNKWKDRPANHNHVWNSLVCADSKFSSVDPNELSVMDSLHTCKDKRKDTWMGASRHAWSGGTYLLLLLSCVSVPWEFARLYQAAVGKRAATMSAGIPEECSSGGLSVLKTLKSWLSHQMAWSHGTPCDQYFYALFVDPLWEISPLMVLTSLVTRCLVHPAELLLGGVGRGLRSFFTEIPVQWQPLLMVMMMVTALVALLMTCSYRLSCPWLFRIEPRTPVSVPRDHRDGSSTSKKDFALHGEQRSRDLALSQPVSGRDERNRKTRGSSSTPHSCSSSARCRRSALFEDAAGSRERSRRKDNTVSLAEQLEKQDRDLSCRRRPSKPNVKNSTCTMIPGKLQKQATCLLTSKVRQERLLQTIDRQ